ncbi:MAG: hypothetical protein ACLP05_09270 [Candidatus Kryptoniota bacterium]
MKILFLFIIGASLTLDGCGGGLDMTMKPSTGFKRTSSVTVKSDNFDSANLRPKIEYALFKNGINIVSPSFEQTGGQDQGDSPNQLSSLSQQRTTDSALAHSANGQGKGAVYLLKFTYNFDYTFSGEVITDFSAAVLEPGTGDVVGIISYHGGGHGTAPDELANTVGKKLSQQLK